MKDSVDIFSTKEQSVYCQHFFGGDFSALSD